MSSRRHLVIAVAAGALIVGLGWLLLVWPTYREGDRVRRQITEFADCGELARKDATIARLTEANERLEAWMDAHQRYRPAGADIAGLVKALSHKPVDGRTIFDRAFNAREPKPAVPGSDFPEMALPLDVDLEAQWSAVFELLEQVERLDRLVRVASVHLECNRRDEMDVGVATTTITLEAIYDPSREDEVSMR